MVFLLHLLFYSLLPLFFSIFFLFKWLSTAKTQSNLPPSPPKLPIIGNLHQLGVLPHRSLQSLAQQYGPIMLIHFGSKPVLIASSADAAREFLKTHDLIFSNRPKSSFASRIFYDKDIGFIHYGEYWRQVRSICVLNLLSNRRVQSFRRVREEETAVLIDKIKGASSSSSVVNLSEMFASLTNDVLCRVALGRKYSESSKSGRKFKELLGEIAELTGVFNVGDYIPWLVWLNQINGLDAKVEKVAKEVDEFLEGVIDDHLADSNNGGGSVDQDKKQQDFVDVLLEIQRENMDNFSFHRDTIKALILDMFFAGTHTTSTTVEWTMTELLRHPKVMEELQNEVREIARGKLEITEDDLDNMQYLKAVMKESMRLHPPAPLLIPRESTQDVKVMGYHIAAGTQLIINVWAIGRDPLLWEEPEHFQPERFLNTSIDYQGNNFKLIPFGTGRRSCPGIQFARTVYELALANLVHKFDFRGAGREEDFDITEAPGTTVNKKYPLLAVATPSSLG